MVEFYGIPVPVPQDYTWIINAEWGGDALHTLKSKTSANNGDFFSTWVVGEGEKPPPMPIDEQLFTRLATYSPSTDDYADLQALLEMSTLG